LTFAERIEVAKRKEKDAGKRFSFCKLAKVLALLLKHAIKIRSKYPE